MHGFKDARIAGSATMQAYVDFRKVWDVGVWMVGAPALNNFVWGLLR